MPDALASLTVARSQLGVTENPAGSNRTPYGAWYGLDGQPWCDMFQSWVADRAGNGDIVGRFAYTPSHAAWFQGKGQWHTTPAVGDLVFYNFGAGRIHHVGIVEAVRTDGIITIEGNTAQGDDANGGQVQRRYRTWDVGIVGYGRPAYTTATATEGFGTMDDAAIDAKFLKLEVNDRQLDEKLDKVIGELAKLSAAEKRRAKAERDRDKANHPDAA